MLNNQTLKTCSYCGIAKSIEFFNKKDSKSYQARCRECLNKRYREYWKNLPVEEKKRIGKLNTFRLRNNPARLEKQRDYLRHCENRLKNCKIFIRFSKADIIKRDGLNCYLCGKILTNKTATIDHITPVSRGGDHKAENVKIACLSCNQSKNKKTLTEFKKWRGDYNYLLEKNV